MATKPKPKPKLFNGKPMDHWDHLAKKLVVEILVSSAHSLDEKSIVGKLASARLLELAQAESPELSKEVAKEREERLYDMAKAMKSFLP